MRKPSTTKADNNLCGHVMLRDTRRIYTYLVASIVANPRPTQLTIIITIVAVAARHPSWPMQTVPQSRSRSWTYAVCLHRRKPVSQTPLSSMRVRGLSAPLVRKNIRACNSWSLFDQRVISAPTHARHFARPGLLRPRLMTSYRTLFPMPRGRTTANEGFVMVMDKKTSGSRTSIR